MHSRFYGVWDRHRLLTFSRLQYEEKSRKEWMVHNRFENIIVNEIFNHCDTQIKTEIKTKGSMLTKVYIDCNGQHVK